MLYWTDYSKGMIEIPFEFGNTNKSCEAKCPFKDKASAVCSCGFTKMQEMGCITTFESSKGCEDD